MNNITQAPIDLIYEAMRRVFFQSGLAGHWNFIERWAMKFLQIGVAMFLPMFLSGCLYGQCFDGPCALEHERILNSIKAYGEYFEKPGMTKESWRADWMACGGRGDGQYTSGPREAGEKDDFPGMRRKEKQLSTCMQSKGYEYRNVPLPAK